MRMSPQLMAIEQKMDFQAFIQEWREKHAMSDHQWSLIASTVWRAGWDFFIDELIEYYLSRPDLYRVYDDTVELLEY